MLIKDKKINLVNFALIIYIFSIIVFNEGTMALKIVRVFFVGIMLINLIGKKKIYLNKFVYWMLAFWILCLLSIKWTISIDNSKEMVVTLLYNLICNFFVLNLLCEDRKRIILIIKTIIFSSIILFGRIALQHGILVYVDGRRGGNNGLENANTIGTVASIAVVLGIYCVKEREYKYPIIYYISIIANISVIVLSASRKAILYALIPIIFYYIVNSKNSLKVMRNIVLAVVIFFITYFTIMKVPILYSIIGNRVETMINGFTGQGETDASTSLRMKMIEWGVEWFKEKPKLGYGIDSYKMLLGTKETSFGITGAYAHNNYIELIVDVGILGLVVYYYIYIYMIIKSFKYIKSRNLLLILMLGILIACMVNEYGQVTYYYKFYQLVLLLIYIVIQNEIEKGKEYVK